MRKKKTTRTIELTFERNEFFAVFKPRRSIVAQCAECGGCVPMVTPEEAASVAGVTARTIYHWVEAGRVHFMERSEGLLLICLYSLSGK